MNKATFAAGCFWCIEDDFRKKKGVLSTKVGYTGGNKKDPTYKDVCTGTTGHAEAIEIQYDPKIISYETLLDEFWAMHDPTTLNRQGPDIGTQYRSVIFYHDEEQKKAALKSKKELENSGRFNGTIVTEIIPTMTFWEAEDYHQQYMEKQRSCRIRY